MRCLNCDGAGCNSCNQEGVIQINCCPLELITSDVWQVISLAELYEKGLPPIAGGALDQAKNFVDAALFIFQIKTYLKNKTGRTN